MMDEKPPSTARLMLWMALFVVAGIPFVAILWETLNHLLALKADSGALLAIPAFLLLAGVLYLLSRSLMRTRFGSTGDGSSSHPEPL